IEKADSVQWISAKHGQGIETLKKRIVSSVQIQPSASGNTIVTNVRHYEQLRLTHEALQRASDKIASNMTSDWLALDIRDALNQLGEITGEITTNDLLAVIFSKFCIGK
ncbi:MAG: tRNA uridine-5-carboxymethylaminomethyl(34) synthesis GTPase MnmE, partial [Ferruginibacter sp.]|nr:tRNA uridine-5-carboxymethylaminomethyl(34) synthesis GTPase MnmE [Cytophagales bacterium]